MYTNTLFNLIVAYDKKYSLKPVNILQNYGEPVDDKMLLLKKDLDKFSLPVNKSYLLVSRRNTFQGMKYNFKIFKVQKNFRNYILGSTQSVLEESVTSPLLLKETIDKKDLVTQGLKGLDFATNMYEYVLCEFPDINKLKGLL